MSGRGGVPLPRVLPRERLLDRLQTARVGVVEAGGGYGKSLLAEAFRLRLGVGSAVLRLRPADAEPGALAATLQRALRAARLSDLAVAIEGREGLEDYSPAAGDLDQFMSFGSLSGQFSNVTGTNAGGGLYFVLEYDPGAATFVVRPTSVQVKPKSGAPGAQIVVKGKGFSPGETISISFGSTALAPAVADSTGAFSVPETVPSVPPGTYQVKATGQTSYIARQVTFTVT